MKGGRRAAFRCGRGNCRRILQEGRRDQKTDGSDAGEGVHGGAGEEWNTLMSADRRADPLQSEDGFGKLASDQT